MTAYVTAPVQQHLCIWTGSNLAEMQVFIPWVTFTVNPDTTLSANYGQPLGPDTLHVGDCYTDNGQVITGSSLANDFQPWLSGQKYEFTNTFGVSNAPERRSATVAVPALSLLGKTTINVTWPTPMPSATYDVSIVPLTSATTVGSLNWSLVNGSQTATGCQIAVSAILAITLGSISLKVSCSS